MQLNNQIKELKQEINTLRLNMTHLDQEKDRLLVSTVLYNTKCIILLSFTIIFKKLLMFFADGIGRKDRKDRRVGTKLCT